MILYRKKLNSLEELKREQIRLRYERRHTTAADLNPLTELTGSKTGGAVATTGILGTLMGLFAAKNNTQLALTLGKPLLKALRRRGMRRQAAQIESAVAKPKRKSFFGRLVTEVLVGYTMGKALQLSILTARTLLRKRKAQKVRAQQRF